MAPCYLALFHTTITLSLAISSSRYNVMKLPAAFSKINIFSAISPALTETKQNRLQDLQQAQLPGP